MDGWHSGWLFRKRSRRFLLFRFTTTLPVGYGRYDLERGQFELDSPVTGDPPGVGEHLTLVEGDHYASDPKRDVWITAITSDSESDLPIYSFRR